MRRPGHRPDLFKPFLRSEAVSLLKIPCIVIVFFLDSTMDNEAYVQRAGDKDPDTFKDPIFIYNKLKMNSFLNFKPG
jgi:hypothetical protein